MSMLLILVLQQSFLIPGRQVLGEDVNEKLAVTLVIDTSGSMRNTDPGNMREMASKIFIDLLNAEDSLGIITFSSDAILIQPMTKIGENKASMKAVLESGLSSVGNTDYHKAFKAAMSQLDQVQEKDVRKVTVFITDGNPDPDPSRNLEEGFIGSYLEELWRTMRTMGDKEYPVYTVGIGALDMEILDRIALETRGKSKVFSEAHEIAKELFNIVAELKNREVFISGEMPVQNLDAFTFEVGKETLQTTFVITHDRKEMSFTLESPDGRSYGEQVQLEAGDKYTLLTVRELPKEGLGAWKLNTIGNGQPEIFGARDLRVKVWLKSPVSAYTYPVGDPLEITAGLTGIDSKGVVLQGTVSFQGKEMGKVEFIEKTGEYKGKFNDTLIPGEYSLMVTALEDGVEISKTTTSFVLKNLPVMKPDFISDEAGMSIGEEKIITSTLDIGANSLIQSKDLSLEYFNLIGEMDGKQLVFPMVDDGDFLSGDIKAGDGRYSTRVSFNDPGQMKLLLQARGFYQNELFIVEKALGDVGIHDAGSVTAELKNQILSAFKGKEISLDLALLSSSQFDELIHLSIPEELGTLFPSDILLGALESREISVSFIPNRDMDLGDFSLSLQLTLENQKTKLNVKNSEVRIKTTTLLERGVSVMRRYQSQIFFGIMVVLSIFLVFIGIGLSVYQVMVKRRCYLQGKLKMTHEETGITQGIDFSKLKTGKYKVRFGDAQNAEGDKCATLLASRYGFDLIFEKKGGQGKSRVISGYRWLFNKEDTDPLVRVTEPGILLVDDQIYTELKMSEDKSFKSGDYFFQYEYNGHKNIRKNHEGRNLLEGRL